MFAKWLNEYQENYLKTRFISQLPAFLIFVFSLLSLYSDLRAAYSFPEYVKGNWRYFWVSVFFHIFVFLFFGIRFILLFFSSKKSFWFSQLFWFVGLITLFAWSCYTEHSFYGIFHESFNQMSSSAAPSFSEVPDTDFVGASQSLSTLYSTYFFISPIRQFFTFIISVFKRW